MLHSGVLLAAQAKTKHAISSSRVCALLLT
jgi:hypothetical protein